MANETCVAVHDLKRQRLRGKGNGRRGVKNNNPKQQQQHNAVPSYRTTADSSEVESGTSDSGHKTFTAASRRNVFGKVVNQIDTAIKRSKAQPQPAYFILWLLIYKIT